MSYQQKGLKAIRLSQINQTILKARKSQEYPTEWTLDQQSRNNLLKQNRAIVYYKQLNNITQHNSFLIMEDEFQKMRRPQTSNGSRRKKMTNHQGQQIIQNSNTKYEILECENEDDKEQYHWNLILFFLNKIKRNE